MKFSPVFLSVLLISGCTSVWTPVPGVDLYTQAEAETYCLQDANKQYPEKNEVAQRSVMRDVEKKCRKDDDCGKDKTYKEQTPVTESYVLDVNEESRNRYFYTCMKSKGWDRQDKYLWE